MALILATDDEGGPEIFASVQGEGPSMGMPVAFMRLSRCNLACRWCDTAYTWRFTGDNRPHRDEVAFERGEKDFAIGEFTHLETRIGQIGGERLAEQRVVIDQGEATAAQDTHIAGMVSEAGKGLIHSRLGSK